MTRRLERQFVNSDEINKHLFCSICQEVFLEPTRLFCSHIFCKKCITHWLEDKKTCPICREKIDVSLMGKDQTAHKIIRELQVKCCNKSCTWQDKLEELDKHYKACPYTITPEWVKDPPNCIKIEDEDIQDTPQLPTKTPLILPSSNFHSFPSPFCNYYRHCFLPNLYHKELHPDDENSLTSHNFAVEDDPFIFGIEPGINLCNLVIEPTLDSSIQKKKKKKKKSNKRAKVKKLSCLEVEDDENEGVKNRRETRSSLKRRANKSQIIEEDLPKEELQKKIKRSIRL